MIRWRPAAFAALALALAGCSGEAAPTSRGVYLLMDTSGTYTQELDKAQVLINAILARVEPGNSFAVAGSTPAASARRTSSPGSPSTSGRALRTSRSASSATRSTASSRT